ncbi:DUF5688 family protein [Bariatricus sp. SGI.154]|uniref:DUF5688 family protein n=1 Tax=Bariatricus sp. SGI.154 TaxID=3420549 RepID=UPI003D05C2EF
MNYYQFIHAVEVKVKEGVEDNITVYIQTSVKNNGTRRLGITLAERGINISPTIYLEEYYQQFQQGNSVDDIAGDILRLYREIRFQRSWEGEFIRDYQKIEGKIVYHLVNREANKELLKEVPYEEYLDLAIIFYVLLEVNSYGMASMLIRDEHLKMWGVTDKEIYQRACQNTWRVLPYEFETMHAVIEELTGDEEPEEKDVLYILSNRIRSYGAAAILYENRLEGIGDYLKENYYVLPSSVHEMIIVPESEAPGKEELCCLVTEINETQVDEEEVLSNQVYYYDRKKRKLLL